jgi:aminoglycoside phosphotransferase (APT) family kinase protein
VPVGSPVTDPDSGSPTSEGPVKPDPDRSASDGIDAGAVTAWFVANIAEARPPFHFELIAGGRSNLTFAVTDVADHRYVLRRPPTGHLLPTAHDMAREYRIIDALRPAGIPVAPARRLCTDPDVNGAPFYVMDFVDGVVPRTAADAEAGFDLDARRRAGHSLVETLAAIHAIDPDVVGLGDLGRKEGYVARQLRRWYGQFRSSRDDAGGPDVPDVDMAHDLLLDRIPEQGPASIVHGDYRLDNAVFDTRGRLVAVLDWELCTLGDPLVDVAQLLLYWSEAGETSPLGHDASTAPAFPTRADLVARYAACSGRDLGALEFYNAFVAWKVACILEGVYTRYLAGSMGDIHFDYSFYPATIAHLGAQAKSIAAALG